MGRVRISKLHFVTLAGMLAILTFGANGAFADNECASLPSHAALRAALIGSLGGTGGLENNMWATVVNRDGVVCAVVFTGGDRGAQWPASRVISAQKANTANALSLAAGAGPGANIALSTANLYSAVQPGGTLYVGVLPPDVPGGSLYGLQHSNPVDTSVAYGGNPAQYGQPNDHMVGNRAGGVNVFGGGLGLYTAAGKLIGGLGVSGDTSCADHIVAWRTRHALNLDNVPGGVAGGTDNIIHDLSVDANGHTHSTSGFGHPACSATSTAVANALPADYPIGPTP